LLNGRADLSGEVGDPWLVREDVYRVLEHSRSSMAGESLRDDERDVLSAIDLL
jgi:prophage antirepressor-like protein